MVGRWWWWGGFSSIALHFWMRLPLKLKPKILLPLPPSLRVRTHDAELLPAEWFGLEMAEVVFWPGCHWGAVAQHPLLSTAHLEEPRGFG